MFATIAKNEELIHLSRSRESKAGIYAEYWLPSQEEAVHLLQVGNVYVLPMLNRADINRAYAICDTPVYVKGKFTLRPVSREVIDPESLLKWKRLVSSQEIIDGMNGMTKVPVNVNEEASSGGREIHD